MKLSRNLSKNLISLEGDIARSLNVDFSKNNSYGIYGSNDFINSAIIASLYKEGDYDIFFVTNNPKKCKLLIEHLEQSFSVPSFYLSNEIFHGESDINNERKFSLSLLSFIQKHKHRRIKFIDSKNMFSSLRRNKDNQYKEFKKNSFAWGRNTLIEQLEDFDYRKKEFVEELGDYAIRGSIIDFFSPAEAFPVRVEFKNDKPSSMQSFNLDNERRIGQILNQIKVVDTKSYSSPKQGSDFSLLDSIDPKSILIFDSGSDFSLLDGNEQEISRGLLEKRTLFFNPVHSVNSCTNLNLDLEPIVEPYDFSLDFINETIAEKPYASAIYLVTDLATKNKLIKDLDEKTLGKVLFVNGFLRKSFYLKNNKTLFLSFNKMGVNINSKKYSNQSFKLSNFVDLEIGNYIVHKDFGLSIYKGIKNKTIANAAVDFIECEFTLNDKLLIPIDKINLIQKYVGSKSNVKLDSLRTRTWSLKVKKAKKVAENIAKEILSLYAQRKSANGFSYQINEKEIAQFEDRFEYQETIDQKNAILGTYRDMQSNKPMDRLICGDVGFGKTEVALRASYLASINSKQTVILAPTTPLVHQHLNTFQKRFENLPVRIEALSRFVKPKDGLKIEMGLTKGVVDIIIGTSKILSDKIKFKNLGLVIIDEEHKFGVSAKEKIKKLKIGIDSLSLSATPIPRTLQLSLSGLRDISLIGTPPKERLGVETYIEKYDKKKIKKAIEYERSRGGKIFFIHNEIRTIEKAYRDLTSLLPNEKIRFVHGKMKGREIEDCLKEFIDGDISILITTTIVESGLDIKSVNTIIINNAHNFGLSDLYQLRGRIGRGSIKGIAYLLIPDKEITENAKKRLSAMKRLTKLGSGFNLALEDLEIRGAGNLFGIEQSGNIYDVGIEFYLDLLEKEVNKLKDNKIETSFNPEVEVSENLFIPKSYISSAERRLLYYKRISLIEEKNDSLALVDELLDKFGSIPSGLLNLIHIADIKLEMKRLGASKLQIKPKSLIIKAIKLEGMKDIDMELPRKSMKLHETLEFIKEINKLEDIVGDNYEFKRGRIIIN